MPPDFCLNLALHSCVLALSGGHGEEGEGPEKWEWPSPETLREVNSLPKPCTRLFYPSMAFGFQALPVRCGRGVPRISCRSALPLAVSEGGALLGFPVPSVQRDWECAPRAMEDCSPVNSLSLLNFQCLLCLPPCSGPWQSL